MFQPFSTPSQPEKAGLWTQPPTSPGNPAQVARALHEAEGFIWLDSSMPGPGKISLITAWPESLFKGHIESEWPEIERLLTEKQAQGSPGGLFGWVGFDGNYVLGLYPHALLYDHDREEWFECGNFSQKLTSFVRHGPVSAPEIPSRMVFEPGISREDFLHQVRQAQEYIRSGDIYQVNLSYLWRAAWRAGDSLLPLYERLRQVSPAPHATYMSLAGTTLLSASPELFLKISGRNIATHPIKGTRPRFPDDKARDEASARELLACEKERAELLMITDLERNDLGQICEFGSVKVPELWRVESFAQVYHLVSTVTGTLRPEISHGQALRACFPGGSITGAPKKRALEIIRELEPCPRGIYTGAVGYFGFDGDSQWNIVIRTVVQEGNCLHFHTGAGIVADSVPEKEWEETLHKASGILTALG